MLQVEVHCHFKNDRVVQWCEQAGIHVTAYAPLSSPQSMANSDVPNLLLVRVFCCFCLFLLFTT